MKTICRKTRKPVSGCPTRGAACTRCGALLGESRHGTQAKNEKNPRTA